MVQEISVRPTHTVGALEPPDRAGRDAAQGYIYKGSLREARNYHFIKNEQNIVAWPGRQDLVARIS